MVVDRDQRDPSRDEPHRTIARMCRTARVEFIAAREAIGARLLADSGICRWLGISQAARTDVIRDPKRRMAVAFDRELGRPYRKRRARPEVARQASGVDRSRDDSLRQALAAVERCVQVRGRA
jgi:hypothetical protein